MPEKTVIEQCSPTLAGIKTGNLFSIKDEDTEGIVDTLRELNGVIREKGLRIVPIKKSERHMLIYMYRPDYLKHDFNDPDAINILKELGYSPDDVERCLAKLAGELNKNEGFPHEIGLFLGYPPRDVKCFMKDPDRGVQCTGYWKAYGDKEEAVKTFNRYNHCTKVYKNAYKNGRTLAELTVKRNA